MARLLLLLALIATPARAEDLAALAASWGTGLRPTTVADAPQTLAIDHALVAELRRQPLDGGREVAIDLKLQDGRLVLHGVRQGARYTAPGRCADCNFPQPVAAHTHPYDNAFSPRDLIIVARDRVMMLVVLRGGGMFLAVPTTRTPNVWDTMFQIEGRAGHFANRAQCPAHEADLVLPAGMPRHTEALMRLVAADLDIALYQLTGGVFRRLPPLPFDVPVLEVGPEPGWDDLNTYELVMSALMRLRGRTPATTPTDLAASARYIALDFEDQPVSEFQSLLYSSMSEEEGRAWFAPLPTTVYLSDSSDLTLTELPFISLQWSADCRQLLWLAGVQTFAPNAVRYTQGWRRPATFQGPLNQGWTPLPAAEFPTDHVVRW